MSELLANWLQVQRESLFAQWMLIIEQSLAAIAAYKSNAPNSQNGSDPSNASDMSALHREEEHMIMHSIYEGLIAAATGDTLQLDEALNLLHALRHKSHEGALIYYTQLVFKFGQASHTQLDATKEQYSIDQVQELRHTLDHLIEHVMTVLIRSWLTAAQRVEQDLHETRMLVESLYRDSEASDRTTLHVSLLNEISQGLATSLDQYEQLTFVGERLQSALDLESIAIWWPDEQGHHLRLLHRWGNTTAQESAVDARQELPSPESTIALDQSDDLLVRSYHHAKALVEEEFPSEHIASWRRENTAALVVPLLVQGRSIGVIALQDPRKSFLLDRVEQDFILSVANQSSLALENARLYREVRSFNMVLEQRIAERTLELKAERDTLETLNNIALDISSTLDENLLMDSSLTAISQLVGAHYGSVGLFDRETEQLIESAVIGREEQDLGVRFPIGRGISGWVAQTRKTALVPDVSLDTRWVDLPDGDNLERKRNGAMLVVPLVAHHELLGVMVLSHEQIAYFNEEHCRVVEAAANQVAIGLHNAQIYKQLEQDFLRRYEMQQAQEQAVSQSNAILQSLSDGVIVCDKFGSVITANPAAERVLERPLEELLIWNVPELIRHLMGQKASELPIDHILSNPSDEDGNSRIYQTLLHIGTRVISVHLNPVLSTEKQLAIGALLVFRDITREVEADRLKNEFIGTVTHELRTPMTSIKGFTQLLVMGSLGPVNDTQQEFLNIIQVNAERMIAIINDLLDITKIETGSVELDMRSLHVAEVLSSVLSELQPRIRDRGQEISVSIPPGLPLVRADQQRFNQILYNLFSNAIKYTAREGRISLSAREITLENIPEVLREGLRLGQRYVQIDISDTGVGIAPEEQEHIFERFYRTENPFKIEAGGTGLGLALVRPLVKLFGGRIWVNSTVGEGSTFSFALPQV